MTSASSTDKTREQEFGSASKDLKLLAEKFANSCITALQVGSRAAWIHLRETMELLQPFGPLLCKMPQVQHYLKRTVSFVESHTELDELKYLKIPELVKDTFHKTDENTSHKSSCSYQNLPDYMTVSPQMEVRRMSKKTEVGIKVPMGIVAGDNIFKPLLKSDPLIQPRPLVLSDVEKYLPHVVAELSRHEAIWMNSLGLTIVALNTEIPSETVQVGDINQNSVLPLEAEKTYTHTKLKIHVQYAEPKTGLEVVEYLVRTPMIDMTQIWYLNLKQSRFYKPYDIVVVSRTRTKAEHFVISIFGVLHVKPDGESELFALGRWYREAVLFNTLTKINFFKNFLLMKSFRAWKENIKFQQFCKVRKEIETKHIMQIPSMCQALVQIYHLLKDLDKISLMPSKKGDQYTLDQFNHEASMTIQTAKKLIEKLFSYCQGIVDKVVADCIEYLSYCEYQIEQKNDNIKESMTVAKERRESQMKNLKLAKTAVNKLGCFARLIDQVLLSNIIEHVSSRYSKFVYHVVKGSSTEVGGFLFASLDFDSETHGLMLLPSFERFRRSFQLAFDVIPASLAEVCIPMKVQGQTEKLSRESLIPANSGYMKTTDRKLLSVSELKILLTSSPQTAACFFKHRDMDGQDIITDENEVAECLSEKRDEKEFTFLKESPTLEDRLKDRYVHLIKKCFRISKFSKN